MRLIDVDKMIDFLKKAAALEDDKATRTLDEISVRFIERVINHYVRITEKDLGHTEDVVRCKDCKHRPAFGYDDDGDRYVEGPRYQETLKNGLTVTFEDETCPCVNGDDFYYSYVPKDDWFCANGERRENNEQAD